MKKLLGMMLLAVAVVGCNKASDTGVTASDTSISHESAGAQTPLTPQRYLTNADTTLNGSPMATPSTNSMSNTNDQRSTSANGGAGVSDTRSEGK